MQKAHWRDTAIARSEVITDAWEVTKAYACRVAEWILFCCMVMNIIEILPAVMLGTLVSNIVLATQAVTLDIAGFGLASMADHARRMGDEEAARRAEWTGYLLITIMVVTIALVTCGALWPVTRWFTDPAEKVLILVRVVMTVVYGHVLHGLRRVEHTHAKSLRPDVLEEMAATFNQRIQDLHTQLEMLAAQPSQVETSKLDALHTQWEGLATPSALKSAPQNDTAEGTKTPLAHENSVHENDTAEHNTTITFLTTKRAQENTQTAHPVRTKNATKMRTAKTHGKASKAARYIKSNPKIGATELAKKSEISVTYARKLLTEKRAQNDGVND